MTDRANKTALRLARLAPDGARRAASYGDGRIHRGTVAGAPRQVGRDWIVTMACDDGRHRTFGAADFERTGGA